MTPEIRIKLPSAIGDSISDDTIMKNANSKKQIVNTDKRLFTKILNGDGGCISKTLFEVEDIEPVVHLSRKTLASCEGNEGRDLLSPNVSF